MLQKLFVFFGFLLIIPCFSYSQTTGTIVKGKVLSTKTKAGLNGLDVQLLGTPISTTTLSTGDFSLSNVPAGSRTLVLSGNGISNDTLSINVGKEPIDLGEIFPAISDDAANDLPTISIEDAGTSVDGDGDNSSSQNAAGIYSPNNDQYLFLTGSTFFQYRFKNRGVDNMELQVNGIELEDLERGYHSYTQLGGLNDVLRSRNTVYGLAPSSYAYGSTNGSNYIEATAADMRKGANVSYTLTNKFYRNRVMATYSSGIQKNGWAYSLSGSRRWSEEGYTPGTFYDGYSAYGSVSKVVKKGVFSFTGFVAPTKRGQAAMAIDEAFQLAHDNQYNPDWGYQNGKKRNSRVVNVTQPFLIANYIYRPSDRTRWNTAIGYQFGTYKNSIIDFYNANNPNPDYYRKLPSYYMNFSTPQPYTAEAVRQQLLNNPDQLQMDWDRFFNSNYINYETIANVDGIAGNNVTGRRSMYVYSNRVDDLKKASFNTNIEHSVNEHVNLYGGLKHASQQDRYYKELVDLLGGDFYLNNNQFANQQTIQDPSFTQNDLKKPNQLVKVGDKYGYDYNMTINQSEAWAQAVFSERKVDYFIAANGGYTSFAREGFMQNGLFPNNSYGKSDAHSFVTYKVKGGITWKLDAKNFFYLNADYSTDAPKVSNTYISAQKRDFIIDNPVTQKSKSVEAGYILKSPVLYARVTGYVTDINDAVINKLFFNDDPSVISFVNYIMRGVNTRSLGTELSANLKLTEEWSVTGIASVGQAFYTNRPFVSFYQDNQPGLAAVERKVYLKDYYLATGPQSVYVVSVNYRSRKYWNGRVNFNYTDNNYVDINPDRRTQEAADLVDPGSAQWKKIYAQEKLPAAFTIDVSGGKSFNLNKYTKLLHNRTLLVVNIGVGNVLNKTDIKTSGYEQLRYDYTLRSPNKFPNKYAYGYGINYFATISLRF